MDTTFTIDNALVAALLLPTSMDNEDHLPIRDGPSRPVGAGFKISMFFQKLQNFHSNFEFKIGPMLGPGLSDLILHICGNIAAKHRMIANVSKFDRTLIGKVTKKVRK